LGEQRCDGTGDATPTKAKDWMMRRKAKVKDRADYGGVAFGQVLFQRGVRRRDHRKRDVQSKW
jgi:hypothetical protein